MVKTRMSVVDCARMAAEVNALLAGSWVQNIYTTEDDAKTFLFKLTGRGDKYFLLLESGVRFHPTEFVRDKSEMPTGFAMKLRKHVRGRRLEYCRQVGLDRVVDFAFGKGTQHHHVVLEMYAGGNVILTDEKGVILTILRPYTLEEGGEGGIRVAVGQKYPFDLAMEGPRALLSEVDTGRLVKKQDLQSFMETFLKHAQEEELKYDQQDEEEDEAETQQKPKKGPVTVKGEKPTVVQQKKKKKEKKKRPVELEHMRELAQCLASKGSPVQNFGPQLIEHCLVSAGFDPTLKLMDMSFFEANADALCASLDGATKVLAQLRDEMTSVPGYIVLAPSSNQKAGSAITATVFYEGFEPFKWSTLRQEEEQGRLKEFTSFHLAVDEFYASIEAQRAEKAKMAQEKANQNKIENVKKQQAERVESLKIAVDERERAAFALESNIDVVDKAIAAVNSLIGSGMSWDEVDRVVKSERRAGNPIASLVAGLKLAENKITLQLTLDDDDDEFENDDDEEEERHEEEEDTKKKQKSKPILVDVDLSLSAQANAGAMFSEKKRAATKAKVTAERAAQAVEEMQSKLAQQETKKKSSSGKNVRAIRKPFWFEKFHWFITSEGVLVLGGKDAHQNEQLFKRFLRKGDAYLHADIHGAPTVIVRNPYYRTGTARTVPPESMRQAGIFCVCKSPAWQAKIVTSAWWVESSQVSRTAPSGEYLPTGSFMIRGKKNYLQPTRLEMGFGYIFKIDVTAVDVKEEDNEDNGDNNAADDNDAASQMTKHKEWRFLKGKLPPLPADVLPTTSSSGANEEEAQVFSVIQAGTAPSASSKGVPKQASMATKGSQAQKKKGGDTKGSTGAVQKGKGKQEETTNNTTNKGSTQAPAAGGGSEVSKKKLLKQKRAQAKYGDQTEEERRLAMIALGHALPPVNRDNEDDMEIETNVDDDPKDAEDLSETKPKSWLQKTKANANAAPEPTASDNEVQDDGENEDEDEIEKNAAAAAGEEEEMEDESQQQESSEQELLRGFTANPSPDDLILYAIPFCGPVESMGHFKFRVKLVPGTLKKGKAAKQAVALFQSKASERERTIINSVSDPENVAVMMMDVKVSAPGIEKVRANIKNQQKKAKKDELEQKANQGTQD